MFSYPTEIGKSQTPYLDILWPSTCYLHSPLLSYRLPYSTQDITPHPLGLIFSAMGRKVQTIKQMPSEVSMEILSPRDLPGAAIFVAFTITPPLAFGENRLGSSSTGGVLFFILIKLWKFLMMTKPKNCLLRVFYTVCRLAAFPPAKTDVT